MALPTVYNTGTATVTAGDTAATGQGTTWLTSGIQAGDLFWAAGLFVRIASVNSNTSITLASAWPGSTRTAAAYEIAYTPDATRVLASARALLDQLSNGNLSSISGLTFSADKLLYSTGAGATALSPLTAFARGLLDDSDAATMRATLGVSIGSQVQAYNANLASLAGLTLAADKLLYSTAVSTVALATLTSFARTLLDDADAATARATLGAVSLAGDTMTGPLTIGGNTYNNVGIVLNGAAGSDRYIAMKTAGVARWYFGVSATAESGSNAGSNVFLGRLSDAGAYLDDAILVQRSNGQVTIANNLVVGALTIPSYTVSTLPAATAQRLIYVSNGTANKRLAVADGANWRFPDGAIVS